MAIEEWLQNRVAGNELTNDLESSNTGQKQNERTVKKNCFQQPSNIPAVLQVPKQNLSKSQTTSAYRQKPMRYLTAVPRLKAEPNRAPQAMVKEKTHPRFKSYCPNQRQC